MPDRELKQTPVVLRPDQIDRYWVEIERGLLTMQDMPNRDWTPEQVREELKLGDSHIFCVTDRWDGFVIYRLLSPATLWISIAYGEKGSDIAYYWRIIIATAKKAGIEKVAFGSARTGWGRLARRYGFSPTQIVYELELN